MKLHLKSECMCRTHHGYESFHADVHGLCPQYVESRKPKAKQCNVLQR
jgi:hypothetical protein